MPSGGESSRNRSASRDADRFHLHSCAGFFLGRRGCGWCFPASNPAPSAFTTTSGKIKGTRATLTPLSFHIHDYSYYMLDDSDDPTCERAATWARFPRRLEAIATARGTLPTTSYRHLNVSPCHNSMGGLISVRRTGANNIPMYSSYLRSSKFSLIPKNGPKSLPESANTRWWTVLAIGVKTVD